ncbi:MULTISPECIES: HAD family hydrolase [unclassified Pseudomonas]|uniref:HAD family hydrolase n=1 Tax=unclassified Pseudomonas TaxID=196821 RepID=UPI0011A96DC1|nr:MULTISPECIES: 2-haloalkanoic acid dehalogenase [unclassified Pseudomonas]TWC19678.1 phosphoglycolate phosphatase-like HAD superfamily hydrolase [Pseudomonas sp. SJZ075]TWC35422.1 phosphoglycolate phosphatase-like HAD superfamily hydrolase [Pseudomonas sp. SJZ078]TWC56368.1 phosphoglycolate phosphatase-like HAD superfamily hydrolase [Pseudomonas sp. SJZ124]TWC91680.1 phosphoglycolate phosphatase-like HAD superfamily hydrolase [Pseudomonas sp. SJZ101]
MELTDYRALLIDCDEVLFDRNSGIWTALQPLLENYPDTLSREQVLAEYDQVMRELYPRFSELGFSGLLCFAHRQLAERLGLKASWEEGMTFARSVCEWSLYEDAPGAMLYLRKFYRLLVYGDRDSADREAFCERLGIASEDFLSPTSKPLEDRDWLLRNDLEPKDILLVCGSSADVSLANGVCLIQRGCSEPDLSGTADFYINSMADLVTQHQQSLRR